MHLHILGICGTFMGGIAQLAKAMGHHVTGSDTNVYPPMSTQLEAAGITLYQGYDTAQFDPEPDVVVIGNALSRGNPAVEYILARGLRYSSGPQWLAEHVLQDRWVLAVAGTHGKTTTSSLLAWILEHNDMKPGFLIGGVPGNFGVSARLGDAPFFVVEADEYDTAFFDKRSKFVHYHPRTLVINNIEFDHADIFANLEAIQTQFHHLVRTIPNNGLIIKPANYPAVEQVLARGCWTPLQGTGDGAEWQARLHQRDGSEFDVVHQGKAVCTVQWSMLGDHNVSNALAAIAAAHHAGIPVNNACESLAEFKGIKRRMEVRAQVNGITVYDDFAHHPTAIHVTLQGLRNKVGTSRIIAILEPRSNTMRMGVHANTLADSLQQADAVYLYEPANMGWSLARVQQQLGGKAHLEHNTQDIIQHVSDTANAGDQILIMSNGGFEGLHQRLIDSLKLKFSH
ncbi:MAG: UDP-N-acetylmuramate:L-alanyl-gamma-D-glutamyl-meso-diaminopimelate ligase [Gammaproteobacteria bacterium]|nr:UDP-N-acetylmuramate:L-alanyl-gamma-D-glutamyl-meso-diaminopimelate ligase [Gammaproteobacteria bacterium]